MNATLYIPRLRLVTIELIPRISSSAVDVSSEMLGRLLKSIAFIHGRPRIESLSLSGYVTDEVDEEVYGDSQNAERIVPRNAP